MASPRHHFNRTLNPATCIMVGPFPPPVIGSAVVTQALRNSLVDAGYQVRAIDSAAGRLVSERCLVKTYRRLGVLCKLAFELTKRRSRSSIYIAMAGGNGQYGDLINVILARLFRCPLVLHHHSFAYIQTPRVLTRWVFALAGRKARHIFLCGKMRRTAMDHYPTIRRGYVLSNAALIVSSKIEVRAKPPRLRRIGFFSNIEMTKGIDRFLELARLFRNDKDKISFEVAGPYRDRDSQDLVEIAAAEGLVTYHGTLFGEAKQRFFETINMLVLPSRYRNEAEPLVVLEALMAGVPVIATDRGCIAELIGRDQCLLDANAEDLKPARQQIEQWILMPDAFAKASYDAASRGLAIHEKSLAALRIVLRHMAWRAG